MKKTLSVLSLLFVGFWLYPLLFVPLVGKLFPDFLDRWIEMYAEYLRLWGL
jgi:hypothetical protein